MNVLIGRMPGCRHAVAIDCDTSKKGRKAMAKEELDVETMPLANGNKVFIEGLREHYRVCLIKDEE